jgi:hypothetical protein
MPYVIRRVLKRGVRYTAIYTDENGRYKSAGAYDSEERALQVADQHERHVRLRRAGTSPADKATITVRDFGVKFLREHAVEPNTKLTYARLLNARVYPFIGKRRVAEIGRERFTGCSHDAFSSSLTTTVFSQRSMRRFEASLRRATPKGQDPSSPAQHRIKDPSYIGPSLRSGHTSAPTGPGRGYRRWTEPSLREDTFVPTAPRAFIVN